MLKTFALCLALCVPAVADESNGTIHLPAFDLPESSFLSDETRAALKRDRDIYSKEQDERTNGCPPISLENKENMPAVRQCLADAFYKSSLYRTMQASFAVKMTMQTIAGVYTEVFTPDAGISAGNKDRVLIDLHGGALMWESRTFGHLESIPIAAVGKIKVISIDYRIGPEYVFPAASEDVAAVYRELLKEYEPENIGIYGSSGGAMLVAQAMALFEQEKLPLPGAIGMFFAGAPTALDADRYKWVASDSARIVGAIVESRVPGEGFGIWERLFGPGHLYFRGLRRGTPLDSPGSYDEVMSKFPPTLLITGGVRDFALSEVAVTHAKLVKLGVQADLHVWEGMSHIFNNDPEFPESREAYGVTVKFFDKHLGRPSPGRGLESTSSSVSRRQGRTQDRNATFASFLLY
jgi:monoterpene epsilon-lactone hydrolase